MKRRRIRSGLKWTGAARLARMAKLNCCPKCGYSRVGLPSGGDRPCPECGTVKVSP